MLNAIPLLAFLLSAPAASPEPETLPAPVKAALDKYFKAVKAEDYQAMAELAEVPWFDVDRKLVRDKAGLPEALRRARAQFLVYEQEPPIQAASYKKQRGELKDDERKLLDDSLGADGWIVTYRKFSLYDRIFLLRVKEGKVAVVGGPLKRNQVSPRNRIPQTVEEPLAKPELFELYSLDPNPLDKDGKPKTIKDGFYGWEILGKTEVNAEADQKRLVKALRVGVEDNPGVVAACFNPRHGLRLKSGGKTVDLVICFECLQIEVFLDGKKQDGFLTSAGPQAAFDDVLKAAKVTLPEPAKK